MRTLHYLLGGMLLAGIAFSATSVEATPPWQKIKLFKRIDADPAKDYTLTESDGPWLIMCCSFSGEGAADDAKALVLELRKRYKLTAFTHQMTFDFTTPVDGRGVDNRGSRKKMKYQRDIKSNEIAVLVGNFNSVEDARAQPILKTLRVAQPECLKLENDDKVTRSLAGFREIQKYVLADGDERKKHGPMGHAFLTTNPLLPAEYFVPKGLDRFVEDLNADLKYSLLECKGKYSIQVAMFGGHYVQTHRTPDLIKAESAPLKLGEASKKAHLMCEALRDQGVDAYEFHDRYCSVVCVGSFDSLGNKLPNGKLDLHPAVLKIIETYGPQPRKVGGKVVLGAGTAKVIKTSDKDFPELAFDTQPLPVEVPKRSSRLLQAAN